MNKLLRNISPSILDIPDDKKLEFVKKYIEIGINTIHYDIMDNKFVPNNGVNLNIFKEIINKAPKHISNVHLMVEDAFSYAKELIGYATCLTIHYESNPNREEIVRFAKTFCEENWVGLAIKPKTTFEEIKDIIQYFDVVVIMSVEPGFGGQKFIEKTLEKINLISEYIKEKKYTTLIEVDGGINSENSKIIFEKGANTLVCGSFLYKNPTKETLKELLKSN